MALVVHSPTEAVQKWLELHSSPATQSVLLVQTAVHSAFTQAVPAGQSYWNWQVVGSCWQLPSTQMPPLVQSAVVRQSPLLWGTQVWRKSHQPPTPAGEPTQSASVVQFDDASQEEMSHMKSGSQSPCVTQTRGPGTQAMASQCSPVAQSESVVQTGPVMG